MIRLYRMMGICAGLFFMGFTASATAQIQYFDNGSINWSQRMVRAVGIGAANQNMPRSVWRATALRAAKAVALRNALELVKGINLTSETTVVNHITESDIIRLRTEGTIVGAQFSEPAYMDDASLEIEVTIPLSGMLMNEFIYMKMPPGMTAIGEEVHIEGGWSLENMPEEVPASVEQYTGLIIDGRGKSVQPALSPKIIGTNGVEYYSGATVDKEHALKRGVAGYARNMIEARKNARVGEKPLTIKAVRSDGLNKTDLVIESADAIRVHQANRGRNFLTECRLIILVD